MTQLEQESGKEARVTAGIVGLGDSKENVKEFVDAANSLIRESSRH